MALRRLGANVYDALGRLRSVVGNLAFKSAESGSDAASILREIGRHNQYSWPDLSQYTNQAGMYMQSPWVYIAVSKIARAAALVDLHVMKINAKGKREQIDEHPIHALLRHPNNSQSQFEFMEATVGYLQINGNAYWFLNGVPGAPTEILNLRPDRVRIVAGFSSDRPVAGYVYVVDGIEIPLDAEEVIHFRRWHPANDYYGLSALEAGMVDVTSDRAMSRWNAEYFGKDKAIPAGVVSIKSPLSDAEYERVQREWRESYGGTQRKTAMIRGAEITYQDIGVNHRDMDFAAGRQFSKEAIMLIFGIPPGMLDKSATEANARAGLEIFMRDTIWPCMVEIAQKLTAELCPLYGDSVVVEADDPRIQDEKAELQKTEALAPIRTVNEQREVDGKPPLTLMWPVNGVLMNLADLPSTVGLAILGTQSGGSSAGTTPNPTAEAQAAHDAEPSVAAKSLEDRQRLQDLMSAPASIAITDEMRAEIKRFATFATKRVDTDDEDEIADFRFNALPLPLQWDMKMLAEVGELDLLQPVKAILKPHERVSISGRPDPNARAKYKSEKAIKKAAGEALQEVQANVVRGVRHVSASTKAMPDSAQPFLAYFNKQWWADQTNILAKYLQPLIQDGVEAGATQAAGKLGAVGIGYDTSTFPTQAAQYALDWTDTILQDFGTTTQDGVGALLGRYVGTPGATMGDLVDAIQNSMLFSEARAATVATTESSRIYAEGEWLGAKELADIAHVPFALDRDTYRNVFPCHVKGRCFGDSEFQYDDPDDPSKITGMDFVYSTMRDSFVCPICEPRDGRLVSEIADEEGL